MNIKNLFDKEELNDVKRLKNNLKKYKIFANISYCVCCEID
jgi:hypothetical protein